MPYIVTRMRPVQDDRQWAVASRRAVATLEEAQQTCDVAADAADPTGASAQSLSDDGGTIGPLPDGTVIEVETTSYRQLASRVDTYMADFTAPERAAIVDAFNARQS